MGLENLLHEAIQAAKILDDGSNLVIRDTGETPIAFVQIINCRRTQYVGGNTLRLAEQVHVLPRIALFVLAPNSTGQGLVVELANDCAQEVVLVGVYREDQISHLHGRPCALVNRTGHCTPGMETLLIRYQ